MGARAENLPFGGEPQPRAPELDVHLSQTRPYQQPKQVVPGPAMRLPHEEGALILRQVVLQTSQGCVTAVYGFAFERCCSGGARLSSCPTGTGRQLP